MTMKIALAGMGGVKEMLIRREAELVHALRNRSAIAIEKSPDQMDEIQDASERDLALGGISAR